MVSEIAIPAILGAFGDLLRTGLGVGLDSAANARADLNNATKIQTAVADAKAAGLSPLVVTHNSSSAPVVSSSPLLSNSNNVFGSLMNSLSGNISSSVQQKSSEDFNSKENAKNRAHEIEVLHEQLDSKEKVVRAELANAKNIAEINAAVQRELQNKDLQFRQMWEQLSANERERAYRQAVYQANHEFRIREAELKQKGQQMKMTKDQWIGDYIATYITHFLPSGSSVVGGVSSALKGGK